MTHEQFAEHTEKLFDEIRSIGQTKGKEYADGQNRFANFLDIAKEVDSRPELVLYTYMVKPWRAIQSFLRDGKVYSEPIQGRIRDVIVYLMMLDGLITEQQTLKGQEAQGDANR